MFDESGMLASRSGLFARGADRIDRVMSVLELAGLPRRQDVYRLPAAGGEHVYRVGYDFVVRIGDPAEVRRFRTGCELQRAIPKHLPGPGLLFEDLSCDVLPGPAVVTGFVRGRSLAALWPTLDDGEKLRCLDRLADALAGLHEINWPKIPSLAGLPPWPERRRAEMQALLSRAYRQPGVDRRMLSELSAAWADRAYLLDTAAMPVLVHREPGDIVCSDEGEVRSLVDFDGIDVAPREVEHWLLCDRVLSEGMPTDLSPLRRCHGSGGPFAAERRKLHDVYGTVRALVLADGRGGQLARCARKNASVRDQASSAAFSS